MKKIFLSLILGLLFLAFSPISVRAAICPADECINCNFPSCDGHYGETQTCTGTCSNTNPTLNGTACTNARVCSTGNCNTACGAAYTGPCPVGTECIINTVGANFCGGSCVAPQCVNGSTDTCTGPNGCAGTKTCQNGFYSPCVCSTPTSRYKCSGGGCIEDPDGPYTRPNCNLACRNPNPCTCGGWSTCSRTCGGGTQTRTCTGNCLSNVRLSQSCNTHSCTGPGTCRLTSVVRTGPNTARATVVVNGFDRMDMLK